MRRRELNDEQWERLRPLLSPQKPKNGRPAKDHRQILNAILWLLRTGAPWRDSPERYGLWRTVATHFYRWRKTGVWDRILEAVQQPADGRGRIDWGIHHVDGTMVRAHQHAAGAKEGTRRTTKL
jgi:transposase